MKIKIGGLDYTIAWVDESEVDHDKRENGEYALLYGEISYTKQSVHINKGTDIGRQQRCLMHEVLHGIVEEYKIREIRNGKAGRVFHSEEAIDQLALGLVETLTSMGIVIPTSQTQNKVKKNG